MDTGKEDTELQQVGSWAGGVAQVVDHLLNKSEDLSSNLSAKKKKKKARSVEVTFSWRVCRTC
jgi:hypothetical protein